MTDYEMDDVDRGILHALQEDARRITTGEMAERVGVSSSTVRNRIDNLEESGIITGYHPEIDYERAGYELHVNFSCLANSEVRERVTRDALGVDGVIETNELLGEEVDLTIEAIAEDATMLERIHDDVADLPLEIRGTSVYRDRYVQPFDHFGSQVGSE